MELTEDQQSFLASCEKQFSNRFAEQDQSFMDLKNKPLSCPPIVDPWDNHSNRDRYSRGGNRNQRNGRDQHPWRDDRGSGYSRHYNDRSDSSRNQDRNHRRPHPYEYRGPHYH